MRKCWILLGVLVCGLFGTAPVQASGSVIILCYHTFLGTHTSSMDFSRDEIAAQMDAIAALGYRFVTLDDALAGNITGNANIVVTLDDGNHSNYAAVKKVFLPRGIKPELFISPAIISHSVFAMTWEQLKELSAAGCGIGAHGYFHNYLSLKAFKESEKDALIEVERPAAVFTEHLGSRPLIFAYPFGLTSPQAEAALVKQGYSWAFIVGPAVTPVDFTDPALNRLEVPRTIVYRWSFEKVLKELKTRLGPVSSSVASKKVTSSAAAKAQ